MTLKQDEQMLWYDIIERINAVPLGERTDGALFNMIRRVKRTKTAKPPFFQRIEIRHNTYEIQSFYHRLWGTIDTMLQVERALDNGESHFIRAYPTPAADCHWSCDHYLTCPLFDDGSRVEAMIERYYIIGDPLAYYYKDLKEEVS